MIALDYKTPVCLGACAYSRRWFAERLGPYTAKLKLKAILDAVEPIAAAAGDVGAYNYGLGYLLQSVSPPIQQHPGTTLGYYLRLVECCARLFPVSNYRVDIEMENYREGMTEVGELYTDMDLAASFVPVEVYGIEWCDLWGQPAPILALCAMHVDREDDIFSSFIDEIVTDSLAGYEDLFGGEMDAVEISLDAVKPPRGREWISPWDGVRDLWAYAHCSTGCGFLDYSEEYVAQYGSATWRVDEVLAYAEDWANGRDMWGRIVALREHVEEKRHESMRMRLLAGVLRGEKEALMRATRPKRNAPLVEVMGVDDGLSN